MNYLMCLTYVTWKSECNIKNGGHTNKCVKNNKMIQRIQLDGDIREIRMNYFSRKNNQK